MYWLYINNNKDKISCLSNFQLAACTATIGESKQLVKPFQAAFIVEGETEPVIDGTGNQHFVEVIFPETIWVQICPAYGQVGESIRLAKGLNIKEDPLDNLPSRYNPD